MRRKQDMQYLMQVFCTVVDEGSFTKAAYLLGSKTSSVSKAVTRLEADLGIKLIERTTRSLGLTDAGTLFYDESSRILYQVKCLQDSLLSQRAKPVGNLKVTASVAIGQYFLGPIVPEFMRLYPDISIELMLTDKVLDYNANNIDVAFRSVEKLSDSSLYSIQVSSPKRIVVASPDYIEQFGAVSTPEELKNHTANLYRAGNVFDKWRFVYEQEEFQIRMKSALVSNNYTTIVEATRRGTGVANLFDYLVEGDLQSGRLIQMLEDYPQKAQNVFMLYANSRSKSPKLDAFLSFVKTKS